MLKDPLNPAVAPLIGAFADSSKSLRVIELGQGRSVRLCDGDLAGVPGKAKLSIAHSVSKENKAVLTDRSAVRLEVRKTSADNKEIVAQVTVTASLPRAEFTATEVYDMWLHLGALLNSDSAGLMVADTGYDGTASVSAMYRVLNGEA